VYFLFLPEKENQLFSQIPATIFHKIQQPSARRQPDMRAVDEGFSRFYKSFFRIQDAVHVNRNVLCKKNPNQQLCAI